MLRPPLLLLVSFEAGVNCLCEIRLLLFHLSTVKTGSNFKVVLPFENALVIYGNPSRHIAAVSYNDELHDHGSETY